MSPRTTLTSTLNVLTVPLPAHLTAPGLKTFTSQTLWRPKGARGVFGGQVIAQSLSAASQTITPPLGLHSQHCYFLLPADASIPIIYAVESLRDGKSYTTRLVKAWQGEKTVFILVASYALPPISLPPLKKDAGSPPFSFIPISAGKEKGKKPALSHSLRFAVEPNTSKGNSNSDGAHQTEKQMAALKISPTHASTDIPPFVERFQVAFPEGVLPWAECEDEEARWARFLNTRGGNVAGRRRKAVEEYIQERSESPIAIAVARRRGESPVQDDRDRRTIWMRARLQPNERPDTETIKAMIAYMTDFQFIGTAALSVGLTRISTPRLGMLASLDHTTHFYPLPPDFDPSAPLLHVMHVNIADVTAGRGVVRGLLYTAGGVLLAVTSQEGVVRADLGKEVRGLVENGGMGDEVERGKDVKAKL